ncbi:spore germination protein GerXB [Neobacillus ginsengisoli]|uniref:Spore germination protein (Amino acid permease) n=1 Tax=Neobacillus ginsengisoli TaxID=904295 RepID=A0ABT9Y3A3_9BACI|nr:endospore germination permease [Neobacillus ginsengisoli]MDQ0202021.1 spore germination protein (amino acid permease) [Neobacillus ginsengisoli]
MKKQTISLLQMSLILIGSTGIINHVVIIPMLLDVSGRDSWITILFSSVAYLFLIPILFFIQKRMNGEQLFLWLRGNFGVFIAYPLMAIILLYLFFLSVVTLKETLTFLSFYLPMTPKLFLGALFSIICFYNSRHGIQSIALTTGILLPIVFVLGFFVMTANFPNKDFSLLKPYLEHGISPIINGMIYPVSGYIELGFILYLHQYVNTKIKFTSFIWIGIIFITLTLGPTIGAITEFGPFVAAKQRYPAFEEWRLVAIGRYIEHLDFLSVYQWFVGAFIRLSLLTFLIPDLLQITNKKVKDGLQIFILGGITLLSTWSINDSSFYWFLSRLFMPYSVALILFLSVFLAFLSLIVNKKKGIKSNEAH